MEQIDQQLFLLLNSVNSPFWDSVMYFLSMKLVWAPLYLGILIWMGRRYNDILSKVSEKNSVPKGNILDLLR